MAGTDNDRPEQGAPGRRRIGNAERDVIALGIALAAIIMFVGTGGAVVPHVVRSLAGLGLGPDKILINALLLNVALIIFGWRRYRQLSEEVHERRRAEEQARLLAETDPLTGCLNRRSIADSARRLMADGAARGNAVAMVMIDLDNFKQINDFNGHSAGDALLREVAGRIGRELPEGALLARLGGDEFAAIVPFDPRRTDMMDDLATALISTVGKPCEIAGVTVEVTASIGLGRSDQPSPTSRPDKLMHMADIAMYQSKKQGRNRYSWFESSMESELRYRSELESGIRRGIPRGEFVPFYEQQIDLQTGELTGFEMLARWNSPTLGVVSPEIFIPVAEEIGVIGDLSESVIAQALHDARRWDPRLTLSVNISALQLRDPWFAQKLLKLLVEANFPANRLEIEITESALHENLPVVRALMTSLKNQGIRISLDDFGTGYSSLAQLRNLPFDRIKIDRTFITNVAESRDSAAIVNAVALLGKDLGLPITAEGVETQAVLDALARFGDIKGQGYLYGQPQSAAATRDDLARRELLRDDEDGSDTPGAAGTGGWLSRRR